MRKKGLTLVELLVAIGILSVLAIIAFRLISSIMQKAKVVTAKAQIAQLAQLLERVKSDTSFYPVFVLDLISDDAPNGISAEWDGPYTHNIPLDPWGSPYFYQIPPTTLFISPPIPRSSGHPDTYSVSFETNPGTAILRIENWGVTACHIYLNGVEVVNESEFKNFPKPQIIEKTLLLAKNNNLLTWARSNPGEFMTISVSSDKVPTKKYFILGSYGKDKKKGGENFNTDIIWRSDKYPNFQ